MEEQTAIKLPIEKDFKEKLKIFFMAARSTPNNPVQQERFVGIVAYRQEDAFLKAQSEYAPNPQSLMGIVSHGDFAFIEDLFRSINTNEISVSPKENVTVTPKEEKKVMPIETFKAGLTMAAEEYIKDEQTKHTLKQIIEKIK